VQHLARSISRYRVILARLCSVAYREVAPWACVRLSVSVSVSVTSRCSTKTVKRRITQTTPHDTQGLYFLMPKISAKFDQGHPLRGRRMQVGWVKIGDFRRITGNRWQDCDWQDASRGHSAIAELLVLLANKYRKFKGASVRGKGNV